MKIKFIKQKNFQIITVFLLVLGLLAGCTTNETSNSNTSEIASTQSQGKHISVEDLDPTWMKVKSADETGKKLKVALSTMNITNDNYWTAMAGYMQEYVEGLGHEFILSVASSSWGAPVSMQVNAIEDLISADIDILVFHAFDANALVPVIQKCNDAGITVVNIDSKLADEESIIAYVGINNADVGTAAAEGLLENQPDVKKFMVLGAAEGNPSTIAKTEAFKETVLEKSPGAECVGDYFADSDPDTAMSYVQNTLVTAPDLEAIYVVADNMITGVIQALEQAGKKPGEVKIVGTNGFAYVVPEIENEWVLGTMLLPGKETVLTGAQIAISSNQGLLKEENIEKNIDVVSPFVSADNLDDYKDMFY